MPAEFENAMDSTLVGLKNQHCILDDTRIKNNQIRSSKVSMQMPSTAGQKKFSIN